MFDDLIKIAQSVWYLLFLFVQLFVVIAYYLLVDNDPLLLLPILMVGSLTVFLSIDYLSRKQDRKEH